MNFNKNIFSRRGQAGSVIPLLFTIMIIVVVVGIMFLFSQTFLDNIQSTATGGVNSTAWKQVNRTVGAAITVVDYLPLIILVLIFGGLLFVFVRYLLPIMAATSRAGA